MKNKHTPYNMLKKGHIVFLEWRAGKIEMVSIIERNEDELIFKTLKNEEIRLPKKTFGFGWRCWHINPSPEETKADSWR